jgi:cytochrome c-type biogenesis protein CcmH
VRKLLLALTLAGCAGLAAVCSAKEAAPAAADPALEARVMALAGTLRCLVCQNETLADSQADLAADLRNQIREKLKAGESNDAIIAFLVARYGDFVLYNPPLKASTSLLWFGPFALLAGAFAFLFLYLRRRRKAQQVDGRLDEAQQARVREILGTPPERM